MHFCFTAPNDCEESEHETVMGYVLSLSSSYLFVYLFIIFSIDTFRAMTYKSLSGLSTITFLTPLATLLTVERTTVYSPAIEADK